MAALPRTRDTARMDTTQHIAALLAQARDITTDTLGSTAPAVVAEVFRALWLEAGESPRQDEPVNVPNALH